MLTLLLFIILLVCVAMVFSEGLWGAALMLINVMTAAMLATNFFEPVASALNKSQPSFTFCWDFLALWGLFAVSLLILRILTDKLSRHKVRFKKPVDIAGGVFFALWVGWVMVQFTLFSLHVSPLSRNFMGGDFQPTPESRMFLGLGPDRNWLAWMHTMSDGGAFSRGDKLTAPERVFDRQGDFILKYGARRKQYEKEPDFRVNPARATEP